MKYMIVSLVICCSGMVHAKDSQLGTTRSDDLQIKARMEYERRNQKQPQSHTTTQQEKLQPQKQVAPTSTAGAPVAAPVPIVSGPRKSVLCKNGGEIRELYVEYKAQGCELFYTKSGATKSQARQTNGRSVCESVFEQMKSTVEKSGFVCEQKEN